MTTVVLTETLRSGTYAKCSDFLRAITSSEVALVGALSSVDRYFYYSVQKMTPDSVYAEIYDDDTLQSVTARSGFSIFDMGAAHSVQMYYSETGAGGVYWPVRSDTAITLSDLPKTSTGGSYTTANGSYNQFNLRYIIMPTSDIAGFSAWFTKFLADPKKMVRPRNAHIARHKDPLRRSMYLNDLMNHRQPFGPSSRRK